MVAKTVWKCDGKFDCKWFVFLYKRCPSLAVNCCQYRLTKYKEGGSINVVVTNKHGYVGGDGIWDWVARPSVFMQSGDQQVWLVWVGILTRLAATVQRENCGAGDQCCNNSSLLSAPSLTGQTLKPVRRASLVMRRRQMSNTTPPSLFCLYISSTLTDTPLYTIGDASGMILSPTLFWITSH